MVLPLSNDEGFSSINGSGGPEIHNRKMLPYAVEVAVSGVLSGNGLIPIGPIHRKKRPLLQIL
jgi:hypothetical protein